MKYISIVLVVSLFTGCVTQENIQLTKEIVVKQKSDIILEDLASIPQDVEYYTKNIDTSKLYDIQKNYEASYFSVWNIEKPSESLENIQWPFKSFHASTSYGENLVQLKQDFFDAMYVKSNFEKYSTLNKKALTLKYSNIRAFPTSKPLLRDPSMAGEGFPFDYLQNSAVNANVPLLISHYSSDKQWVFVFTDYTFGWLKTSEVVFIDDVYAQSWQDAQQVKITKEGNALYNEKGEALFDTRIGMMFALVGEDDTSYTILTVSSYKNNKAMFNQSVISKDTASKITLPLSKTNINKIIKEVSKTNYGWGGVYGQRDCSSTLMDLYVPFGISLPRNSSKQAKVGKVLNLKELNDTDKIKFIKKEAIPFQTLLYKKGHIVLYAGIHNDEIVVYQNVWGIRTKKDTKEGRFIIGKPIFSTLKLGSELENYDESAELLKNIESMNTLTR
ncbi:MAG: cell wall-associated NlpC family hydrolase [Sulfurimonas sp.]|uniref:SH3 domain-containing C40 family peptidase n=1 Tax=Sulfurimonas sp. TaxID=2022749 RepID=UPI0039E2A84C